MSEKCRESACSLSTVLSIGLLANLPITVSTSVLHPKVKIEAADREEQLPCIREGSSTS